MRRIPREVLDRRVDGLNLRTAPDGSPGTFGDQLADGPAVVALLRHLG